MKSFVNVGSKKACLFVHMSKRLLNQMKLYPSLYYAVEEALIAAKQGYYAIGIIVFYELLNKVLKVNSKSDSRKRNDVAHEILKTQPSEESYKDILERFKSEAEKQYNKELAKSGEDHLEFFGILHQEWEQFIQEMD